MTTTLNENNELVSTGKNVVELAPFPGDDPLRHDAKRCRGQPSETFGEWAALAGLGMGQPVAPMGALTMVKSERHQGGAV